MNKGNSPLALEAELRKITGASSLGWGMSVGAQTRAQAISNHMLMKDWKKINYDKLEEICLQHISWHHPKSFSSFGFAKPDKPMRQYYCNMSLSQWQGAWFGICRPRRIANHDLAVSNAVFLLWCSGRCAFCPHEYRKQHKHRKQQWNGWK